MIEQHISSVGIEDYNEICILNNKLTIYVCVCNGTKLTKSNWPIF